MQESPEETTANLSRFRHEDVEEECEEGNSGGRDNSGLIFTVE